jgi:hypothetical protein
LALVQSTVTEHDDASAVITQLEGTVIEPDFTTQEVIVLLPLNVPFQQFLVSDTHVEGAFTVGPAW